MSRDKHDPGSVDMFPGTKRGPGRPKKEGALTPAQRAAAYRERKRVESEEAVADLAKEVRRLKRQLRDVTKKESVKVLSRPVSPKGDGSRATGRSVPRRRSK